MPKERLLDKEDMVQYDSAIKEMKLSHLQPHGRSSKEVREDVGNEISQRGKKESIGQDVKYKDIKTDEWTKPKLETNKWALGIELRMLWRKVRCVRGEGGTQWVSEPLSLEGYVWLPGPSTLKTRSS